MPQQTLRHLTPDQVQRFYLDGCLTVEDVLTPDEVAALAAHTDRIATGELDHIPDTSIQLEPVFRRGEKAVTDQVLSVRKLYNIAVYDDVMWPTSPTPKSPTSSPTCSAPTTSRCTATSSL